MDIEELAPDMGPAGDLRDRGALAGAVGIELVEPGIAVGVKVTGEALKMALRTHALPIRGVAIENGGRCITGMGALVADIDPKPARRGLAEPGGEHRHGRVVGVECAPGQGMLADRLGQGCQQRGRRSDPIGQGGTVECDALAGIDLGLAVKRQVVGVFGHQHMGEQSRARPPALDRQGRHRRLHDRFAQAADDLGADMPDDLEQRDALQHLGLVLAEPAQLSAARMAATAEIAAGDAHWPMHDVLARQVIGQGTTNRMLPGAGSGRHDRALQNRPRRRTLLDILERQFQLVDGGIELLRRLPELHPAQLRQLRLQLLDHEQMGGALRPRRDQQRLERRDVIGKVCGGARHDGLKIIAKPAAKPLNHGRS